MELIEGLGNLLISTVTNAVNGAPWLAYLLVAAWGAALVFNVIHELAGGN